MENLAQRLFSEISALGFRLERLEVQETDTSTVIYTRRDWLAYNRQLTQRDALRRQQGSGCDIPASAMRSPKLSTEHENLHDRRKPPSRFRVGTAWPDMLKRCCDPAEPTRPILLSLADNPLPLWDEGAWGDDPRWTKLWSPIAAELDHSDGFVIVSPEWSGMVPAGLKNFFLLCGSELMAHKPGLIVTVSASLGGSYPVVELRTSSYKNTRLCYLPDHVIVRNVGRMLHGDHARR